MKTFPGAALALLALPAAAFALFGIAGTRIDGARLAGVSPAQAEDVAPTAGGSAFSTEQKKAIGEMIKDYLLKNPELMIEVQTALEEKLESEQHAKLKSFIATNARDIYRNPNSPSAGAKDGDITVVEFFDYNCGYCKRGLPEVQKLLKTDAKVRVVFKEYPILSKGSIEAAQGALAAKRQDKYWEYHQAMLEHRGQANAEAALAIAKKLGLDTAKFKTDMESGEVNAELKSVGELAKKMGINGTPHFLVGDKSIPGAPEDLAAQLEKLVQEFRTAGCSYC